MLAVRLLNLCQHDNRNPSIDGENSKWLLCKKLQLCSDSCATSQCFFVSAITLEHNHQATQRNPPLVPFSNPQAPKQCAPQLLSVLIPCHSTTAGSQSRHSRATHTVNVSRQKCNVSSTPFQQANMHISHIACIRLYFVKRYTPGHPADTLVDIDTLVDT